MPPRAKKQVEPKSDLLRASIAKMEGADREGPGSSADVDFAIRQIVSEHVAGDGVIDIYDQAGIERPGLSLIDADFIDRFRASKYPNLQIEMLKRLLADQIRSVGKRNIVAGKAFSEMLSASVLRYQNHSLDAAAVIAERVELAKKLKADHDRGAQLGLRDDELAFYDAVRQNDSAVMELGDETLKKIARDLVVSVRNNATIDWNVKEQVQATMRAAIKRLLRRYGYPPDKQDGAVELVMHQAERLAGEA